MFLYKTFCNFAFQSTFNMKDKNQYLESIHEIRSIMERSSKFMSLSGLSEIAAGVTTAFVFTRRNAKRKNLPVWNKQLNW